MKEFFPLSFFNNICICTKFFTFCIVFACIHYRGNAQVEPSFWQTLSVTARMNWGSFLASKAKSEYIKDSYSVLGEIDISSANLGKKNWQQQSGFPETGIGLLYGSSGSKAYMGDIAAAIAFINFHLIKRGIFKTNIRVGFGPGWVEKPFNTESNYKNLLIGTHLNACINFLLSSEFQLAKHLNLDAGISFTHLSNGSVKVPNLGLNIPAFSLGITYTLNPQFQPQKKTLPSFPKKINYYLFTFVAAKEAYPLESAVYLVNVVNFEILKDISYTGRFGGGINFTDDRASSEEIPNSPTYEFNKSKSQLQASVYAAYEYVIGNLSIPLQLGVYLYNNYPIQAMYQNIGIRYHFSAHWIAAVELKAHLGAGDFIQWGLGYKF